MITRTYPTPGDVDPALLRSEIETLVGVAPQLSRQGDMIGVTYDNDVEVDEQALEDLIAAHKSAETDQFDQLVEKARRVWNGEDTFTQAQAQKILAGLVLLENRRG